MDARCENYRSEGFDPTGERAVQCNAPAEYCPTCDMHLCDTCHEEMSAAVHKLMAKKRPLSVGLDQESKAVN